MGGVGAARGCGATIGEVAERPPWNPRVPRLTNFLVPTYIIQVTTIDLPASGPASPPSNPVPASGPASPARDPAREPPADRSLVLREIVDGAAVLAARERCATARRVHHSGISLWHLQLLWILQEHGPLPVSRLADMLGIGAPNATGLLDRMEQRRLVERTRDVDDRRVVLVRQTSLGRDAVAEMDGWRADMIEGVLAYLTFEQLEALAAGIRAALASNRSTGGTPESSQRDCLDETTSWMGEHAR